MTEQEEKKTRYSMQRLLRHKLSISSLYSDPCCSVMIASLRDFFFLLRSSTHLMSTKFKEQMIMTTLHQHQTYYTTFKASWVNSILAFWAVSLFILAVCFFISSGVRVPRVIPNDHILIPKFGTKQRCPYMTTLRLKWLATIQVTRPTAVLLPLTFIV